VADPRITPSGWGLCQEPFFESSRVRPTLLMACERLSHMRTARKKRTWGVRGLTWEAYVLCVPGFPLHGVHRFESLRLSDISNHLSHGSLYVAN
jgi:hypothetical protein